jgi:lycopene beta-cyclase
MENRYDYILVGGGMAGLSLAYYLNKSLLRDKKVLLIDRDIKQENDHTWCFWEKERSAFECIVFRKWQHLWFHGVERFTRLLSLGTYRYKMIRAVDFYDFIGKELTQNPAISFVQANVLDIEESENGGKVHTDKGIFEAKEYLFDSVSVPSFQKEAYQNMLQHFLGWVIETDEPVFKPEEATLFDFRIPQEKECRFVYVLPHSEKKALVEFTIFSDNLLSQALYEEALSDYLSSTLRLQSYRITEREFGIVPMSDEPLAQQVSPHVIRIGTAGGYVKTSTGYSFQRTQRRLKRLVSSLEKGHIQLTKSSKWKAFLDSVLLNVMLTGKHSSDAIFTHLFRDNPTERVLRFLDEDTSLWEDLCLMNTVPILPFLKAAGEEGWKLLRGGR